jgi:rhodanese-related sulfurtransferase
MEIVTSYFSSVRGEDEVAYTGKLSPEVHTLPLPVIMQLKVFEMDDEEFKDVCHFPKPSPDDTIVFSCAAGIRSQQAAYFAALGGYTNLINYMGGSNEWFSP